MYKIHMRKTLMNKIKEELKKWRTISHSWIGRVNFVKMPVLPKLIYKFNAIPVKIPASYFVDIDKLISSVYGEATQY